MTNNEIEKRIAVLETEVASLKSKVEKKDDKNEILLDKKGYPSKDYIIPGKFDLNHYLSGVLECIKYHFKPDCIQAQEGEFDILLIDEILCNTKNLRMYSRFGAFYRQSLLNFNVLEQKEEAVQPTGFLEVEEAFDAWQDEYDANSSVDGVEENIINPFTGKAAKRKEFDIAIGKPTDLQYHGTVSATPYEGFLVKRNHSLFRIAPKLSLKEVIKYDLQGMLQLADYSGKQYTRAELAQHRAGVPASPTNPHPGFIFKEVHTPHIYIDPATRK